MCISVREPIYHKQIETSVPSGVTLILILILILLLILILILIVIRVAIAVLVIQGGLQAQV